MRGWKQTQNATDLPGEAACRAQGQRALFFLSMLGSGRQGGGLTAATCPCVSPVYQRIIAGVTAPNAWGGVGRAAAPTAAPPTKDERFAFQQRAREALELSITTRLGLSKTTPVLCKLQPLPTAFVSVGCCGATCSLAFQRSDPNLTAACTDSSGKTRQWHEGSSGCDLLNLECEQWSSRKAESLIQRLCKAVRALLWHPVGSVGSP